MITAGVVATTAGDLTRSLEGQRKRFKISEQLMQILRNTARPFGWMPEPVREVHGSIRDGTVSLSWYAYNIACTKQKQ